MFRFFSDCMRGCSRSHQNPFDIEDDVLTEEPSTSNLTISAGHTPATLGPSRDHEVMDIEEDRSPNFSEKRKQIAEALRTHFSGQQRAFHLLYQELMQREDARAHGWDELFPSTLPILSPRMTHAPVPPPIEPLEESKVVHYLSGFLALLSTTPAIPAALFTKNTFEMMESPEWLSNLFAVFSFGAIAPFNAYYNFASLKNGLNQLRSKKRFLKWLKGLPTHFLWLILSAAPITYTIYLAYDKTIGTEDLNKLVAGVIYTAMGLFFIGNGNAQYISAAILSNKLPSDWRYFSRYLRGCCDHSSRNAPISPERFVVHLKLIQDELTHLVQFGYSPARTQTLMSYLREQLNQLPAGKFDRTQLALLSYYLQPYSHPEPQTRESIWKLGRILTLPLALFGNQNLINFGKTGTSLFIRWLGGAPWLQDTLGDICGYAGLAINAFMWIYMIPDFVFRPLLRNHVVEEYRDGFISSFILLFSTSFAISNVYLTFINKDLEEWNKYPAAIASVLGTVALCANGLGGVLKEAFTFLRFHKSSRDELCELLQKVTHLLIDYVNDPQPDPTEITRLAHEINLIIQTYKDQRTAPKPIQGPIFGGSKHTLFAARRPQGTAAEMARLLVPAPAPTTATSDVPMPREVAAVNALGGVNNGSATELPSHSFK